AELSEKQRRVNAFLEAHGLAGVLLGTIANFAWATGGKSNQVGAATEVGAGAGLLTREGRDLGGDEGGKARLLEEELAGLEVGPLAYPWYRPDPAAAVRRAVDGRVAADFPVAGLEPLPPAFSELRWSLTAAEVERYRWLGEHAGVAMTHALFHLRPGLTEQQIPALPAATLIGVRLPPAAVRAAADRRM